MLRKKRILKKYTFSNFVDYWYYARSLSKKQRQIIFNSLPVEEQNSITKSYNIGQWDDVFDRNFINDKIEELKDKYGYDLIDIRYKVLVGKSVYLPRKFWETVSKKIDEFPSKDTYFVLGGIKAETCRENQNVVLLTYDYDEE